MHIKRFPQTHCRQDTSPILNNNQLGLFSLGICISVCNSRMKICYLWQVIVIHITNNKESSIKFSKENITSILSRWWRCLCLSLSFSLSFFFFFFLDFLCFSLKVQNHVLAENIYKKQRSTLS